MRRQATARKEKLQERSLAKATKAWKDLEEAEREVELRAVTQKAELLNECLQYIESKGYNWGDIVEHVFDAETGSRRERWDYFFKVKG